jgi:hypothetical protein
MTYCAGFGPFTITDQNEEVPKEVSKLRLETRLRETRQPKSGQDFACTSRGMRPLPRWHPNALNTRVL